MPPTADWDPDLYATFDALRTRPFWDLAALIDHSAPIERMVDLGCGSGALTAELARRLRVAHTIGVDSSAAMLDRTIEHRSDTVDFVHGDIAAWTDTGIGLIVANASLQWVPHHDEVLARWAASLAPDGQLAVQVPSNADHPSHTCSVAVAHREPFLSALDGAPPPDPVAANVLAPERYAELLHGLGFDDPTVRLVVYPQVMTSSDAVVDWVSGTSLTRFFARLPEHLHAPFVDAFREELLTTIGEHEPYLYTFKRILMAGRRTA